MASIFNHQQSIIEPTCCLVDTLIPQRSSTPSLVKSYSQPKNSKDKKISLLVNKRDHSQDKSSKGISLSKNIKSSQTNSNHTIKNKAQISNLTTNPSKYNSKIISLSNSRANCLQILKIQRNDSCKHNPQMKSYPLKSQVTFHQTKADSSNVNMLSDITMVQEEFVSHASTTLNALNYLNHQLERSKFSQHSNNTIKLISNYPMQKDTIKQFKNPLEKLAQRRKAKLVL